MAAIPTSFHVRTSKITNNWCSNSYLHTVYVGIYIKAVIDDQLLPSNHLCGVMVNYLHAGS